MLKNFKVINEYGMEQVEEHVKKDAAKSPDNKKSNKSEGIRF